MIERSRGRERERGEPAQSLYESEMEMYARRRDRAMHGRIVVKGDELAWEQSRQGRLKYYLHEDIEDLALEDWKVFVHQIHTHSGSHTHQGGLALYVLKGRGYTLVNGDEYHWEEGDLVLLPILPGGCEHQHFNEDHTQVSEWAAFIYVPWNHALGSMFKQNEDSPDWKAS